MHQSSESIACLAAALAKAQAELTNPEKSLVATIRPSAPGALVPICPAVQRTRHRPQDPS
jgi:hypothetical protein